MDTDFLKRTFYFLEKKKIIPEYVQEHLQKMRTRLGNNGLHFKWGIITDGIEGM